MNPAEEAEIIGDCLEGRASACRRLMEAYGSLVLSAALNVLGNREDAEDACQDTFIQVFRNLGRYDRNRNFKTWLLTIAYRRALDMIRKRRRFVKFAARAGRELERAGGNGSAAAIDPPPLPSRLLETLSARERAALCLWAQEGYTAGEISAVLGCSPGTARVYLFNARRKIKVLLEGGHGVLQSG